MHAIIMAGGRGSRLGALTRNIPKSLVQIGAHSILDIIICQLRNAGFDRLTLCVSHLGEVIQQEFGNGHRLGVAIDYCWDRIPLGTAAPLRTVPGWESAGLVMNTDILTGLDFRALFAAHQQSEATMTVAVRRTQIPVDYGVLDLNGDGQVLGIREKPRITVEFSSGIYVIEPGARAHIPADRPMDMPDLLAAIVDRGEEVRAHRVLGPWHDIGTMAGYKTAVRAFLANPADYGSARPIPTENAPLA